jgi:hypothetical protein
MRSFSWEIFLAGFALFIIAIVVTSRESDRPSSMTSEAKKLSHISEWADVTELSALEKLAESEEYKKLQELSKNSSQEVQKAMSVQQDPISGDSEITNDSPSESLESWTEFSPGSFRLQKNIPLQSYKTLDLELPFGSIIVYGEEVEDASLELMASGRIRDSEWLQDRIIVNELVSEESTKLSIVTQSDQEYNMQLQATLRLPQSVRLVSTTERGHIQIHDITGSIELRSGGGHIEIQNAAGEFDLFTEGGHIELQDVSGSVIANTEGGHIDMKDMRGAIQAMTKGGNIQLELIEAGDSIDLTTEAGNIQFQTDSAIPFYSTIKAIAGIDFNDTAITGNQNFGSFSGFMYPQSKLEVYAGELSNLFKSIDPQNIQTIQFSEYGSLPVINLQAKLGKVSTQFE